MNQGYIIRPGEGRELFSPSGVPQHLKAGDADTSGAYSLWESVVSQGEGAGMHVHPDTDEAFYLLQGELLMRVGDQEQTIGPGTFALVPRGTVHAFTNLAITPARLLTLMSPPMDRFRAALTERIAALPAGSPRTIDALDPEVVHALREQYGAREADPAVVRALLEQIREQHGERDGPI